jgi:hypothetical protein
VLLNDRQPAGTLVERVGLIIRTEQAHRVPLAELP